mmetsp:Transcript_14903/g.24368  ORF Transcript_14903/g.24368 Transcript_14903/m.24368 type:complete len:185 (+) Transcript_14903:104-658(+)
MGEELVTSPGEQQHQEQSHDRITDCTNVEPCGSIGNELRPEPKAGGGNLFLTCLRLRVEEKGGWEEALEEPAQRQESNSLEKVDWNRLGSWSKVIQERPAPPPAANLQETVETPHLDSINTDVSDTEPPMSPTPSSRRNWKEWSGREHGGERYQVGDFARVGVRKVSELVRRWKSSSDIPDSSA